MKPYSITRRLVTTVLLVELLLTGSATAVALLYERNQLYRAFDVMLRGRADSMLGAVQDAEDPQDSVALQTSSLDIPRSDLYEVRTDEDRVIARSPQWSGRSNSDLSHDKPIVNFIASGKHYRGLVLKGVRLVDTEGPSPGITRKVVVFYASPTHRIWNELWEAARFLIFFNSILLVFTGGALVLLLRRSMAPLNDLAFEAAHVSAQSWRFEPSAGARAALELNALVNALESVLKRLEHSFQQQRNFVNDAAHELKTALTVVKSSLQLLDYRERTAEEYKTGLGVCLSDCDRMEDLVQRLLTLARAEQLATEAIPANHQTNLAECLSEVVGAVGVCSPDARCLGSHSGSRRSARGDSGRRLCDGPDQCFAECNSAQPSACRGPCDREQDCRE